MREFLAGRRRVARLVPGRCRVAGRPRLDPVARRGVPHAGAIVALAAQRHPVDDAGDLRARQHRAAEMVRLRIGELRGGGGVEVGEVDDVGDARLEARVAREQQRSRGSIGSPKDEAEEAPLAAIISDPLCCIFCKNTFSTKAGSLIASYAF